MAEQLLNLLQSINNNLNTHFWEGYDFYFGIVNFVVLATTLWYLIKYTKETEMTRKLIAKQTELDQMPVMLLFIRNLADAKVPFGDRQKLRDKYIDYLIRVRAESDVSDYYLRIRNTGKGTAFNVVVESDKFDVVSYETQFFAPEGDEHSIKIVGKGDSKIENWQEFENSTFIIKCGDLMGNEYQFKYKIINLLNNQIEYGKNG